MVDLSHLGDFDRCYAYARVSSNEQADKRRSIDTQRNRLKGVRPTPDKLFEDVQSGDESNRPDYKALIEQAKADALKGLRVLVVITEQSRLSRQGSDRVTELIELFDDLNICLYALDGGKQTVKEPHEWLMRSQEAVFNQYFLRQLRRNLRSAKDQRRKEGKPINPTPPFGYKWSREKYIPDEANWAIARSLAVAYLPPPHGQGVSLRAVAALAREKGKRFSPHGVRQWLLNPVLQGHLQYSIGGHTREEQKRGIDSSQKAKELFYNAHEPLITEEEGKAIAQRLQENRQYARRGTTAERMALSGLVKCANCGSNMSWKITYDKRYGRKYPNYQCKNKADCDKRPSVALRKLEAAVFEAIATRAEELSIVAVEASNVEIVSPEERELQRQIDDLKRMYVQSPVSGIRSAIQELQERLERLSQKPPQKSSREVVDLCIKMFHDQAFFNDLPEFERRHFYHIAVTQIRVEKLGRIEVHLSF